MAIRPRGNAFQADVTVDGRRVRHDCATEAEARDWVKAQRPAKRPAEVQRTAPSPDVLPVKPNEVPAPPPVQKEMRTFAQAVDRTFARYYQGKHDERQLRAQADRVITFWGRGRTLASIDREAMDDLIAFYRKAGMAGGTINRNLAVVSKVMTFAASRGTFTKPRIEREREATGRVRWLTKDEEANLLRLLRQWGKDEAADVVICLLDTGMRGSELWALKARDVTLSTGGLHIWENKTDHPRTIYMTPRVRAIIEPKMDMQGPLFPRDNHWLRHAWDRARDHMGFGGDASFIPYACRHTCASRMIQRGVALPVVKEWLGHKSIQMTMRYAHLSPTNLQAAAKVLAQAGD